MTDRYRAIERECLEHALRTWTPGAAEGSSKRIYRIYLEGSYPETRLKAEGEYTYAPNDKWKVSFPIWQYTSPERPSVSELDRLIFIDILEA